MSREFLANYRLPVMQALESLATKVPGMLIWDPFNTLCPGQVCETSTSNRPLFFDGDHLSGYGDQVLVPDLKQFLTKLI